METFEKKRNINSFRWFTKCYSTFDDDVILSLSKGGKTQRVDRVCITFKNKASTRISKSGYVIFGVDGDRLYFQESTKENGYKMSGDAKRAITQVSTPKFVEWVRNRLNGYTLHKDESMGMYYIETREIKL